MTLSNLQLYWQNAASKRRLNVTIPFTLTLADGETIHADVLLHGYGAENGMLIVQNSDRIMNRSHDIISAGYGYSCMSLPSTHEILSDDGLDELLEDWGGGACIQANAEHEVVEDKNKDTHNFT